MDNERGHDGSRLTPLDWQPPPSRLWFLAASCPCMYVLFTTNELTIRTIARMTMFEGNRQPGGLWCVCGCSSTDAGPGPGVVVEADSQTGLVSSIHLPLTLCKIRRFVRSVFHYLESSTTFSTTWSLLCSNRKPRRCVKSPRDPALSRHP